jgi:hypothetical protein
MKARINLFLFLFLCAFSISAFSVQPVSVPANTPSQTDLVILFDPAMINYFFYHFYAFLFFGFGFFSAIFLAFI